MFIVGIRTEVRNKEIKEKIINIIVNLLAFDFILSLGGQYLKIFRNPTESNKGVLF